MTHLPACRHIVFASTCLAATVAFTSPEHPDIASYHEAVTRYRAGLVASVTREAASWQPNQVRELTRRMRALTARDRALSGWDAPSVAAACLLHLEVLGDHANDPVLWESHLQAMREQLRILATLDGARSLVADLGLGLALHLQGQLRLEDLALHLKEVGDPSPCNALLLLAKGTLYETLASRRLEPARRAALVPKAKGSLDTARSSLAAAVACAPDLAEARLRLARVRGLQGSPDEATLLLRDVMRHSLDPSSRYLAHLFAGQLHVTAGRLVEAEDAFSAARGECSCCQAARVALAHLAFRDHRYDAARDHIMEVLEAPPACVDPWSVYDFGQASSLPTLIEALRSRLQR